MDAILKSYEGLSGLLESLQKEVVARSQGLREWDDDFKERLHKVLFNIKVSKANIDDFVAGSKRYHDVSREELIKKHEDHLEGYRLVCLIAFDYFKHVDDNMESEHEKLFRITSDGKKLWH